MFTTLTNVLRKTFRARKPRSALTSLMRSTHLQDLPSWSDQPREFVIDLSAVRTRDDFMRALSPHFPVGPDHRKLWGPIYQTIQYQACPFRFHLIGWDGFAARMPRYARRLRSYLTDYQRRHGEERLYVEYLG